MPIVRRRTPPLWTILGTNDFESNYDGITYQGTLYFHSSDEGNALWIEKNGLLDSPEVTEMPNLSTNDGQVSSATGGPMPRIALNWSTTKSMAVVTIGQGRLATWTLSATRSFGIT